MAPSSSIFSFEPLCELASSIRAKFSSRDLQSVIWCLVFAFPALAVSLFAPIEVVSPGFFKTNPVRVVHNPVTAPMPGFCEITEDGLVNYPTEMKAEASILIVGNSHSDWNMYPQWIERESRAQGHRIAVYSVARPACSIIEMFDTLIYLLKTTSRRFDMVLIKPGNALFDEIAHPFEYENTDPQPGSGFSIIYTGMPLSGPPFSWKDHLDVMIQKRSTDFYLLRRTQRVKQIQTRTRPAKDVELVTSIPSEVQELRNRQGQRYERVLSDIIQICKAAEIPLTLMTTPSRQYDLSDPAVLAMKTTAPTFFNRYSLLGINRQISDQFNSRVRNAASKEGCGLIDCEVYVDSLPKDKNHYRDFVHLNAETEEKHGKFVYQRLREMGL